MFAEYPDEARAQAELRRQIELFYSPSPKQVGSG
jgi:hypothetical protein